MLPYYGSVTRVYAGSGAFLYKPNLQEWVHEMSVLEKLQKKAAALPRCPGVYIMENAGGNIIYVGKSRSLRDRVSSYFHGDHNLKTERMVSCVADFRFIICDTEIEALTLENSLIKENSPKYNIKLKDAKSYPYIKITEGDYPRIVVTRTREQDKAIYFGPYSGSGTVYSLIKTLRKIFMLPDCKKVFPRDIKKERPCVFYQTGQCIGICTGNVSSEEYKSLIKAAAGVLRGETSQAVELMEEKMYQAAENERFEEAARCRDAVRALGKLEERQKVVASPDFEADVIGISKTPAGEGASLFVIRGGAVRDTAHFKFGENEIFESEEDSELVGFLITLYNRREYIPREILISFNLCDSDKAAAEEYLSIQAGRKISVRTPVRGDKAALCSMAVKDAAMHIENLKRESSTNERLLVRLASILALEVVPQRIEAYDISNWGKEHITAGMVVSVNGKMKKSEYRYFRISKKDAPDDYASMKEAISRRLEHLSDKDGSFSNEPDLILLDGGATHVSEVMKVVRSAGLSIPVFGMVKDSHHKTRALVGTEGEVSIARDGEIFRFIYKLQEEVHRFTVTRMSAAKSKALTTSELKNIKGIGKAKEKLLLKHFGSVKKLRGASAEEISKVKGINAADVVNITEYFNSDQV